jgi:putative addiction module component (TIGR02574 family)
MPTLTHDEITRLSPEERLTLIRELWDSLDPRSSLSSGDGSIASKRTVPAA